MYELLIPLLLACSSGPPAPPEEPAPAPEPAPVEAPEPDAGPAPKITDLTASCAAPTTETVVVELGQDAATLATLYPVRSALPAPYDQPTRPHDTTVLPDTLDGSIALFTRNSLAADGFTDLTVEADSASGTVRITGTGCNLADYRLQLPAFLAAGAIGQKAWTTCLEEGQPCHGMTEPHPCASKPDETCIPWVFYLPLGQPLVNHYGVMLLDYPPADSLCAADYQNNFTMHRWSEVLAWGVSPTVWWSGIVDVHPIAAYGSYESEQVRKTGALFSDYRRAMLSVVTNPPSLAHRRNYTGQTIPVMPAGSPAHAAWGEILSPSAPVKVSAGDMGKTDQLVPKKTTAWVATNHPDVTTYNCCEGDTSESCCDGDYSPDGPDGPTCTGGYGWSWELEEDEKKDFTGACYFENISVDPASPFENYAVTCARGILWGAHTLCVQGRQDYQYTSEGACHCPEAAELFCSASGDGMCPGDGLKSCDPYNEQAGCTDREVQYVECATE